jgi:hypothetical protein
VEALLSQYLPVQAFWDGFSSDGEGDDDDGDEEEAGGGEEGGGGLTPRRRGSSSASGRRFSDAAAPRTGRRVSRAQATPAATTSGRDMRVWAPQCLCLMSHWPCYGALRTALRHLWSLSLGRSRVPLERHLAAMFATPMPRPGAAPIHLQLDLGLVDVASGDVAALAPIILHQPPLRGLPLMDLDFAMPFHSLSLDRLIAVPASFSPSFYARVCVIQNKRAARATSGLPVVVIVAVFAWCSQVFGLMLRETPLLFLSASAARLTDTIEVLRALLFPLDYKAWRYPHP